MDNHSSQELMDKYIKPLISLENTPDFPFRLARFIHNELGCYSAEVTIERIADIIKRAFNGELKL